MLYYRFKVPSLGNSVKDVQDSSVAFITIVCASIFTSKLKDKKDL